MQLFDAGIAVMLAIAKLYTVDGEMIIDDWAFAKEVPPRLVLGGGASLTVIDPQESDCAIRQSNMSSISVEKLAI